MRSTFVFLCLLMSFWIHLNIYTHFPIYKISRLFKFTSSGYTIWKKNDWWCISKIKVEILGDFFFTSNSIWWKASGNENKWYVALFTTKISHMSYITNGCNVYYCSLYEKNNQTSWHRKFKMFFSTGNLYILASL